MDIKIKNLIDENSNLDNTHQTKDGVVRYQHILQFVLPYHENSIIKKDKPKNIKGCAYDIENIELKFDSFENKFGSLGTGLVKRTSITSAYIFDGKIYKNNDGDFNRDWSLSLKENRPFYVLKFVTIKNGEKKYSEKGLQKVKELFPEFVYNH